MNEEQVRTFVEQYYYYILAGQAVFGLLLGLIPFYFGRRRGRIGLGLIGLFACIVVAVLSPLLALVVSVAFTFLAARRK